MRENEKQKVNGAQSVGARENLIEKIIIALTVGGVRVEAVGS